MLFLKMTKLGIDPDKYKTYKGMLDEKFSFVLINPTSEFLLKPGDIVYLLKPGNFELISQSPLKLVTHNRLDGEKNHFMSSLFGINKSDSGDLNNNNSNNENDDNKSDQDQLKKTNHRFNSIEYIANKLGSFVFGRNRQNQNAKSVPLLFVDNDHNKEGQTDSNNDKLMINKKGKKLTQRCNTTIV
jgi:hypothetical protein